MELSELKFSVNTTELKVAVDLLSKVKEATAALEKAQANLGGSTEEQSQQIKQLTEELEKLKAELTKLKGEGKKPTKILPDAEGATSRLSKLKDQLSFLRGEMVQGETGFTKMQAGVMATAKATGASESTLKEYAATFDNFNRITGQNPFDKSVGGLKFLDSELNRLQKTTELASAGFKLTQSQIKLLAQDTEALTQVNKARGASEEEINRITGEHKKVFGERAIQLNDQIAQSKKLEDQTKSEATNRIKLLEDSKMYSNAYWKQEFKNLTEGSVGYKETMKSMKEYYTQEAALSKRKVGSTGGVDKTQAKALQEQARAAKWLANEEERLISVVKTLNSSQDHSVSSSEKAARSIANYERNLRQAGITGVDAASKLEVYRKQQLAIQSLEERRQGKFLTRALQPQIGDTVVSLAAGQNPLTVLLQQGDQIRGLIAQSGIEGKALQDIMRGAFTQTITSIKDTAVAMGSVLGGALLNTGKSITGLVTGPFTAFTTSLATSRAASASLSATLGGSLLASVQAASTAFLAFSKIPLVAIVGTLIGLGVAAYQSLGQFSDLNKALVLNGAALGMNASQAVAYAKSLDTTGSSASKYVDIITAAANEGLNLGNSFKKVADSAINMQKYLGVSVEDTIKNYKKLTTEPLTGLIDLAKSTGNVTAETIRLVAELERQGKMQEAVKIAIDAQTEAQNAAVQNSIASAGHLERIWRRTIGGITLLWQDFKTLALGWGAEDTIDAQIGALQSQLKTSGWSTSAKEKKRISDEISTLELKKRLTIDIGKEQARERQLALDMGSYQQQSNKYLDKQKKMLAEVEEATTRNNRLVAAGKMNKKEAADNIKAIKKEYEDKGAKSKAESAENKYKTQLDNARNVFEDLATMPDFDSDFNDKLDKILWYRDKARKEDRISSDDANKALDELYKKQPFMERAAKAVADENKRVADGQSLINSLLGKADFLGSDYYDKMKALDSLKGTFGIDPDKLLEAKKALEQTTPAAKAYADIVASYTQTMKDISSQRADISAEYSTDFTNEDQKAEASSYSKYKRSLEQADSEYSKALKDADTRLDEARRADAKDKALESFNFRKQLAQDQLTRELYLQSESYKNNKSYYDAINNLGTNTAKVIGDEFANFYLTGKSSFESLTKSFGDMVNSMVADLLRLQVQKQVSGLFDAGIGAAMKFFTSSNTSTGTAGTTSAMSGGFGSGVVTQANGGAWSNGVQMFAKGGLFNGPTMFGHAGGLGIAGEAGPEAIMPLKRDSNGSLGVVAQGAGGNSNVEVVIHNYGSEQATTTESTDSRGNRRIEVTIGDAVASEMSRNGSSTQRALRGNYGLQPQLIRR